MARLTLEQIWINATTLPDAKGNPAVWRRNYSQSPKRQINQIVPFLGTKTVLISASFWGLTEKSVHLSNILFMGCEIVEETEEPVQEPEETQEPTIIDAEKPKIPVRKPIVNTNINPSYDPNTHFRIQYQNKFYWIKKFDMKRQPVLVRCSCSDYYFTWSWSNLINQIQFGGRFKPYVRKTKTHAPRNPDPRKYWGLCKHLAQFASMLQNNALSL
ncbi:MAG TPA: hypothetical protein DEG71_04840 [Clostridiales bacterium]|nr:hypothetical protein [Clostridiales bacterium]